MSDRKRPSTWGVLLSGRRRRLQRVPVTEATEIDHFLPLRLQDVCLLELINDLDCYTVELLSLLPRWLRYRLLNNVPAIDLCRLDHTAVATGIDVDELWKERLPEGQAVSKPNRIIMELDRRVTFSEIRSPATHESPEFDLDIGSKHLWKTEGYGCTGMRRVMRMTTASLLELESAFSVMKEESKSDMNLVSRDKVLLDFIAKVLSEGDCLDATKLTSIDGMELLQNLIPGYSFSSSISHAIWKGQVTSLNRHVVTKDSSSDTNVMLTPKRLLSSSAECDPVHQLSLINYDNYARPTTVNLHMSGISEQIKGALHAVSFAQELGLKIPTRSKRCTTAVHFLLGQVELLMLGCKSYSEARLVTSILDAAMADGQACKLKYLFCTMPDLYSDLVPSLCHVFSLQNYFHLLLDLDEVYPSSLSRLVQHFMIAPCAHMQKLSIMIPVRTFARAGSLDMLPDCANLASLEMSGASVPECAVDHKDLILSWAVDLLFILQLPTIRLNSICVHGSKYIHLCALHPDLLVRKLIIMHTKSINHHEDIVSLLKMRTLQEISVNFEWSDKVMLGLTQGFCQRAQSHVRICPLRNIELCLTHSAKLNTKDILPLWDAIFSLPEQEHLEIVINGYALADINIMYESWLRTSRKLQVKSLRILPELPNINWDILSRFTQEHFVKIKSPVNTPTT